MNEIVEKTMRDIPNILTGNEELLVKDAEEFGKYLSGKDSRSQGISTSQIRNIFSDMKKMNNFEKNKRELILLRPKLAYVAGRHGKRTIEMVDLQKVMDECIQKINDEKSFQNFQDFFEAILAYHKFYGGKD